MSQNGYGKDFVLGRAGRRGDGTAGRWDGTRTPPTGDTYKTLRPDGTPDLQKVKDPGPLRDHRPGTIYIIVQLSRAGRTPPESYKKTQTRKCAILTVLHTADRGER